MSLDHLRIIYHDQTVVLLNLLNRQLGHFLGAPFDPRVPRCLNPHFSIEKWDNAFVTWQVEPYFARARLVDILEPEMIAAWQGEVCLDLS